jgi:hypothetical protein
MKVVSRTVLCVIGKLNRWASDIKPHLEVRIDEGKAKLTQNSPK